MISLPDFGNSFLEQLLICGRIEPGTLSPDLLPTESIRRIAKYQTQFGKEIFLKLAMNWIQRDAKDTSNLSFHVHLECAREEYFRGNSPPVDSEVSQIQADLRPVFGVSIQAFFDSRYVIPRSSLLKSSLLHPLLSFATRSNDLDIELTGSRFDIFQEDGERMLRLNWHLEFSDPDDSDDYNEVIVADIDTIRNDLFDQLLFQRMEKIVHRAFTAVVRGRRKRERLTEHPESDNPSNTNEST